MFASYVFAMLFFVITMLFFWKVAADKHLALDGVHYFRIILENHDFVYIAWSRRFAEFFTEWPLVISTVLGIDNLTILKWIFGAGLFLPYIACFGICFWVVKGQKTLLLIPFASFLAINLTSDYDLVAEHHTMMLFTAVISVLFAVRRELNAAEKITLLLCLVIYSRVYETAFIGAVFFLILSGYRAFALDKKIEKIFFGCAAIVAFITVAIGVMYILEPRAPANKKSFMDALLVNKRNLEVVGIYLFLAFTLVAVLVGRQKDWLQNIVALSSAIFPVWYLSVKFVTDYETTAYYSFSSRSMTVFAVPTIIVAAQLISSLEIRARKVLLLCFSFGFLVFNFANLWDLKKWIYVKNEFVATMQNQEGRTYLDQTSLNGNHHVWSWNNALLSVVWSKPCVRAVILNATNGPVGPVDFDEDLPLKRYRKYSQEFSLGHPDEVICSN